MFTTLAISAAIVLGAGLLLTFQLRAWRQLDNGSLSEDDFQFHHRQFRRRMLSGSLLVVVGLSMLGELWISAPATVVTYWMGIALLATSAALLAVIDWLATRKRYRQPLVAAAAEHAALQAEIRRYQAEQQEGDAR